MTRKLFSKKIFSLLLISAAAAHAWAQEPETDRDLDRQVDVSREYMPDMDRAAKLTIQPVMNDTVSLRPELEYTVAPSPWITGFGVAAINPVRVDAASFEELLPFYLKAGFGIPSRSVVDIYGTTTGTRGGYAGGYINHTGRWSKLRNDVSLKERALEGNNSVGIFGRTYLSRRIALSGEVGYDYDIYSRYGHLDPANDRKSELISYSVPRAAIRMGNDFTDLSFFNFSLGADGYILKDRHNAKESGITAGIALGKRFNVHELMIDLKYEGAFGGDSRKDYDLNLMSVKPSYRIRGGLVDIGASVEIAYSKATDFNSKTFFLPSAALEIKIDGAFRPFATLNSATVSNSYYSVTSRNPYVSVGYVPPGFMYPSRDYKALAGIRGDISSHFAYEVRVGGGMVKDVMYTFYDINAANGYFLPAVNNKHTYFTAGASLTGRISNSFAAGLEADYFNYSAKNLDKAADMPGFKGNLHLRYNWQDKLFIKLRGELTGNRYFGYLDYAQFLIDETLETTTTFDKAKSTFDLGLDAEYRLTRNLGVWLAGDNLLNSKLYPHAHYRGFGISVTAGVKIMF